MVTIESPNGVMKTSPDRPVKLQPVTIGSPAGQIAAHNNFTDTKGKRISTFDVQVSV